MNKEKTHTYIQVMDKGKRAVIAYGRLVDKQWEEGDSLAKFGAAMALAVITSVAEHASKTPNHRMGIMAMLMLLEKHNREFLDAFEAG